jgi:hypothetical protein
MTANTQTMKLRCPLSREEFHLKAQELAAKHQEYGVVHKQKTAVLAEFTRKLKAIEIAIDELNEVVASEFEMRPITCREEPNYARGIIELIREDNGEVASSRPMSNAEKQLTIPGADNDGQVSHVRATSAARPMATTAPKRMRDKRGGSASTRSPTRSKTTTRSSWPTRSTRRPSPKPTKAQTTARRSSLHSVPSSRCQPPPKRAVPVARRRATTSAVRHERVEHPRDAHRCGTRRVGGGHRARDCAGATRSTRRPRAAGAMIARAKAVQVPLPPLDAMALAKLAGDVTDHLAGRPWAWRLNPLADKPYVIALDIGKETGWARLGATGYRGGVLDPLKGHAEWVHSVDNMIDLARGESLLQSKALLVVVEDVFMQRNAQTLMALSRMVGAVTALSASQGVAAVRVLARTWQSQILGSIRRDQGKELSVRRAREEFGRTIVSDHQADAALLALWVRGMQMPSTSAREGASR